jgi:hypothetical protein
MGWKPSQNPKRAFSILKRHLASMFQLFRQPVLSFNLNPPRHILFRRLKSMKTIWLMHRLCAIAVLAWISVPAFANSWVPVACNNTDAGEIDNPGDSQGVVLKNPFNAPNGYGNTSWPGDFGWDGPLCPAAKVTVSLDPSTGTGHTGSPLWFTGTYFVEQQGLSIYLQTLMITVIAPNGSRNVQTLDLSKSNRAGPYIGYHAYQWSIPITFSTTGTYQAFAALNCNGPNTPPSQSWLTNWYQDINTISSDGGVTWNNSNAFNNGSSWGAHYLPLTSGSGSQISFNIDNGSSGSGRQVQVFIQAQPTTGMKKWFTPSLVVYGLFTVQPSTVSNPGPADQPIYPPVLNLGGR